MTWTTAESTFAEYEYGESEYNEAELGESAPEVTTEASSPFATAGYSESTWEQLPETPEASTESWEASQPEAGELNAISPFAHVQAAEDREVLAAEFVNEMMGTELSEALGELAQEWSGVHAEVSSNGGMGVSTPALHEAGLLVTRHADELAAEVDRFLETMAEQVGEHSASTIGEKELASFLEFTESPPIPVGASPAQEQFFKSLGRLVGRVARGAVNLAKKGISLVGKIASLPFSFIFKNLGKIVRPLLRRVLTWAIGRLPAPLQPIANQLRIRIFGNEAEFGSESEAELGELVGEHGGWGSEQALAQELEGELAWHGGIPAVGETTELEQEFVSAVSRYLAAENEAELAQLEAELNATTAEYEAAPGAAELDNARVVLVRELSELRDGESPGPVIERFLPAILPALRIGVRIIGRRRVVNFLADLLAKLIRPLVGPQFATPLSQALVDVGLRIFTLETNAEDRELAAPSAVASIVEDTVRRLAEQGNEVFVDTSRLHSETVAAFNEAVAHTVPASLVRGDLDARETSGTAQATWVLRPRVYWYRKYCRIFEVTLTPQMAAAITTFGGVRLADVLRAQGVRTPVKVRVHLYETLPGTYLSRIAQLEKGVPGLYPNGWRHLHPLSIAAAGILLGEPGLGADVDPRFTRDRSLVAAGQRFFYLQLPYAGGGGVAVSTPSQAFVTIDARAGRDLIRLSIYLSEADAQAIASRARQHNTTAFVIALRAAVGAAVNSLRISPRTRVKVLREVSAEAPAAAAAGVASKIIEKIVDRLVDAAIRLAMDYAKAKADEFVRAADNPANGVSVLITFPIPGLSTVFAGPLTGFVAIARILSAILSHRAGVMTVPGLRRY
ncbi:MAG: hypothetical protein HY829_10825 [Actinobacteria bacterium]|nr:hypothetical protein [Actinomycetota bacterium]